VTVYEETDFGGKNATFQTGAYTEVEFSAKISNDAVSSLKVTGTDCQAWLFSDRLIDFAWSGGWLANVIEGEYATMPAPAVDNTLSSLVVGYRSGSECECFKCDGSPHSEDTECWVKQEGNCDSAGDSGCYTNGPVSCACSTNTFAQAVISAAPTSTCTATAFEETDFGGKSATFGIGAYTGAEFSAMINNDAVSSLKVTGTECQAWLFSDRIIDKDWSGGWAGVAHEGNYPTMPAPTTDNALSSLVVGYRRGPKCQCFNCDGSPFSGDYVCWVKQEGNCDSAGDSGCYTNGHSSCDCLTQTFAEPDDEGMGAGGIIGIILLFCCLGFFAASND
jgi:hypothetical protein